MLTLHLSLLLHQGLLSGELSESALLSQLTLVSLMLFFLALDACKVVEALALSLLSSLLLGSSFFFEALLFGSFRSLSGFLRLFFLVFALCFLLSLALSLGLSCLFLLTLLLCSQSSGFSLLGLFSCFLLSSLSLLSGSFLFQVLHAFSAFLSQCLLFFLFLLLCLALLLSLFCKLFQSQLLVNASLLFFRRFLHCCKMLKTGILVVDYVCCGLGSRCRQGS